MLLPLLVGIMVAKWVADAATHSLYHGLLEVKCIPWLPSAPTAAMSLDLFPVARAMAAPVVSLPERVDLKVLRNILRDTNHNGFPIVRSTPVGRVSRCCTGSRLGPAACGHVTAWVRHRCLTCF